MEGFLEQYSALAIILQTHKNEILAKLYSYLNIHYFKILMLSLAQKMFNA